MKRSARRIVTVATAASCVLATLTGSPNAAMTVKRWENPCDYSCEQQEVAMSPGLTQLVQVDIRIPIASGTFELPMCEVGGVTPKVGCTDRRFIIGTDPALATGETGCRSVNTYSDGEQRVGACALRSAVDPGRGGRAPVTVTTTTNPQHGFACGFSYEPATGKNEDGTPPDLIFEDGAGYEWRVQAIVWNAQNDVARPESGGTRWLSTQATLVAALGGRTLTVNMTGRTESGGPCAFGFLVSSFKFEAGGVGTVA